MNPRDVAAGASPGEDGPTPDAAAPSEDLELYRLLVDNANDLVTLYEVDGRRVFISPSLTRVLGWLPDTPFAGVHPDDKVVIERSWQRVLAGERTVSTLRHLHADGSWRWLEASGSIVQYRGRPHVLAVSRDVTARVLTETERQADLWHLESMERINRSVQRTGDLERALSAALDEVLAIFGCDRAWLGYPCDPAATVFRVAVERTRSEFPGAFAGQQSMELDEQSARMIEVLGSSPGPVRFGPGAEHPLPAVTGPFGVQSMIAMALRPRHHDAHVFGLHQCSSPRVWTAVEERLFREIGRRLEDGLGSLLTLRDLRESRSRLERAARIAKIGYWENDLINDRITYSREAYRILGLTPGQTLTLAELRKRIHPEDRELQAEATARAHRGEARYDVEFRIVRADGEVRTLHSVGDLIVDPAGRPSRAFGAVQDVSELKMLEERLGQAEKLEAVGALAGGVAHDFNNLLTVISGCTELVHDRLGAEDGNRELLAEVLEAAERATNLTRQLLAFSRKQVLRPQVVALNEMLRESLKMLQRLIREDIDLVLATDPDLGQAKVDPAQFEHAVVNLVVNARDAMPAGGRLVIATRNADLDEQYAERSSEALPGPYVVVEVRDSGMGMDEKTRGRMFEPFFTTKPVGQGTGLGLAMVYGFVKQSGGHVEVESAVGKGTTLRVFLPRVEEAVTRAPARPGLDTAPRGTETVLLVEDEEMVRRLGRAILEASGYTVLEASDGEEAIAVAAGHQGPIHLLLSDMVMPKMSGRQVAEALLRSMPDLRVLFMSGYSEEPSAPSGAASRVIPLLQKPFSAMALTRKVRQVLDEARGA